jgi:aminopeptidase N
MVYLPITYFYDTTIRHQLGISGEEERGYFRVVAPHEVAHQWWGHTVGFGSYRDQWMSEGFADFSASLFIQLVWKDRPQEFLRFWNEERDLLTARNREGFRAIDIGPLTLGWRLDNSRAGFNIYRDLIYPKGAYILHMVRMMLWSGKTGDNDFKALMHDFVKNYAGRAATTEDFKAMVEKHMTDQMNLMGDGKMDWFFNEYVYGTALPAYALTSSITSQPDGTPVLNLKITQSNVDANFRMLVPVYLEFADGKIGMLGRATLVGNTDVEQQLPLRGLKSPPKRALLNYYNDVLCSK